MQLVATAVCLECGLVGGMFAPAIFMGAAAGAAYHRSQHGHLTVTRTEVVEAPSPCVTRHLYCRYQKIVLAAVGLAASGLTAFQLSLDITPGAWGILPTLQVTDRGVVFVVVVGVGVGVVVGVVVVVSRSDVDVFGG